MQRLVYARDYKPKNSSWGCMFTCLVDNNLYLRNIFSPKPLAMVAINEDTLCMWHSRLSHFRYHNIIQPAQISEGIVILKLPSEDVGILFIEANMQVEPYKDMIYPGKKPLDLVHSNISEPHIYKLYETKYYVIFLCNATKQLETILLKEKSGILLSVKRYCQRNKKDDKRVC